MPNTPKKAPPERPSRRSDETEMVLSAAEEVDLACRQVSSGKRAAFEIARWGREVGLSETEFRLLWLLSRAQIRDDSTTPAPELNQRWLADALAVSPAQLSNCVASLAAGKLLEFWRPPDDRRRQLCKATDEGRRVIASLLRQIGDIRSTKVSSAPPRSGRPRKGAA